MEEDCQRALEPSFTYGCGQCWKCHDISSTFQVSGLPDTISANDNQMKEKSAKITDISSIYQ